MSCNESSLLQLQSELGTSCSERSEQDWLLFGQAFCGSPAFDRFKILRELNSEFSTVVLLLRQLL